MSRVRAAARLTLSGVLAFTVVLAAAVTLVSPAEAQPSAVHGKARAKPAITAVTPAKGLVLGGTTIVIKGRNFKKVKSVTIGGVRATRVKVLSPTRIRATTPAGFPGNATVKVATKAGKTKASKRARFRYVDPPQVNKRTLTPAPSTFTATDILWVTGGGGQADDPQPGQPEPWVVGLPADVQAPEADASFYVPPGTVAYPAGLTGKVESVSTQTGGTSAVTVLPAPATDALNKMVIQFSGPLDGSAALSAPSGARRRDVTPGGVSFPKLGPNSFLCQNQANGQSASFTGSLGIHLENTRTTFDLDAGAPPFAAPSLSAWIRTEVVLTGKVTGTASIKCGLSPAFKNTHKFIFAIGAATVSLSPDATFSVSGAGTVEFTNRSRRMYGLTIFHNHPSFIDNRTDLGTTITGGALSVSVDAAAGIAAQFGALDRVGLEGKALLAAQAKVTVRSSPRQACVDATLGFKISINGFLDAWVAHWTTPGYSKLFMFGGWRNKCTQPTDDAIPDEAPSITSYRLPAATARDPYSGQLTTADGRAGTWAVVAGALPPGLTLDPGTGVVSGTPSGSVGDYAFNIRFTDGQGRFDTETVRLFLNPERPVGGGVVQATLIWGNFADIDLHLIEPSGEEIYYGHRTSATNGQLDRDTNAGCGEQVSDPIENIYWPAGQAAPAGQYTVFPFVWSPCGMSDLSWRLIVRLNGSVVIDQTGSGTSSGYTFSVGSGVAAARRSVLRVTAPAPAAARKDVRQTRGR